VSEERRYAEPESVEEALALLGPDALPVAGGTDLVAGTRSGKAPLPAALIALHRIGALSEVEETAGGGLRLGALVSHATLETERRVREHYAALSDAAALVGSPATRYAGTIGGNLCNASPAMDTGSPLLVHEAEVEIASRDGRRTLPLAKFVRGPGLTALGPGELVTAVLLPPPPRGSASGYLRLEYRQAMEIAIVGAAALVVLDDEGRFADARLALTAVAPICLRVPEAEDALRGQLPTKDVLAEAARLAARATQPIDDVRASAGYRRAMVMVFAQRALALAVRRGRTQEIEEATT
jgi:CO/xanthine dehydrogenase FAD-binding subunit